MKIEHPLFQILTLRRQKAKAKYSGGKTFTIGGKTFSRVHWNMAIEFEKRWKERHGLRWPAMKDEEIRVTPLEEGPLDAAVIRN